MPTYPHGPRLQKGAIVTVGLLQPVPATIMFQYNPESVKRSLQPQMGGGEENQRSPVIRYVDAPMETIDLEISIDATDQLEQNNPNAIQNGIYPQLSMLELLAYPASPQVILNTILLETGTLEVAPLPVPLTLFVWGANRVVPVRLNSLSISEELFDPELNPLRATVSLNMRTLTYADLSPYSAGYSLYLAYQQTKEVLAAQAMYSNTVSLAGTTLQNFF